jgi:hypothetical protein
MKTLTAGLMLLTVIVTPWVYATVSTSSARNDYTADGAQTQFPYTFRVIDKVHLEVIDIDATGAESVKTVDTDYNVDGVGNPSGGNVTFSSPPASGHRIVILRKQPIEQSSDYILNEGFPSDRVEKDLDKQAMVDQMQNEQLGRAVKLPKRSPATNVTIPPPTECNLATSRFFAWKTDGSNIECAAVPAGATGPTGPVGPGAPGMSEAELQSGSALACADSGSTDSYACNLTPALGSYTAGMVIFLKANAANTGAASVNVNSLGVKSITKNKGAALADNDIKAGQWIPLIYDGANFEIFNGIPNNAAGGGGVTVLDQTATDVTVGNTTTETTVYTKSIPGGTLGTVGKLRLTIHWRMKQHAAGTMATLRLKYGATTVISESIADINQLTFAEQISAFELMGDTINTLQVAKTLHEGIVNGGPSLINILRGTSAVDSSASQTLAVTFQWSAADGANQSAVIEHATLELVK